MKFSIVIPTKNRIFVIMSTIKRLIMMKYSLLDYEIIVVDNNSTDGSFEKLNCLKKTISNLIVVRESKQGASFARNAGIRYAKHKHVICIDDDIMVPPDFLIQYARGWKRHRNAVMIGGSIAIDYLGNPTVQQQRILTDHKWIFGKLDHGSDDKRLILGELAHAGNVSIYKSNVFFSESFGVRSRLGRLIGAEDLELSSRLILENKEVWFCPLVRVIHPVNLSRCNKWYVLWRFFSTGIDLLRMDKVLKVRFGSKYHSLHQKYTDTFLDSIKHKNRKFFRVYCSTFEDVAKLTGYYGASLFYKSQI